MTDFFGSQGPDSDYSGTWKETPEGLGPLDTKGELAPTEVIQPQISKRVFSGWIKQMPVGFGFLISRYTIKLYFFRWIVGVGFIPEEVVWEREEKRLRLVESSEKDQSAII